MSRPSTVTRPPVGGITPASTRIVVDLRRSCARAGRRRCRLTQVDAADRVHRTETDPQGVDLDERQFTRGPRCGAGASTGSAVAEARGVLGASPAHCPRWPSRARAGNQPAESGRARGSPGSPCRRAGGSRRVEHQADARARRPPAATDRPPRKARPRTLLTEHGAALASLEDAVHDHDRAGRPARARGGPRHATPAPPRRAATGVPTWRTAPWRTRNRGEVAATTSAIRAWPLLIARSPHRRG